MRDLAAELRGNADAAARAVGDDLD